MSAHTDIYLFMSVLLNSIQPEVPLDFLVCELLNLIKKEKFKWSGGQQALDGAGLSRALLSLQGGTCSPRPHHVLPSP